MKSLGLLCISFYFLPLWGNAQLGGFVNKVKSKLNESVDKKIDKKLDKTLGEPGGKETPDPATATQTKEKTESQPNTASFTKYDFVAGEKILFYNNFQEETPAELPTGWNTNGTGEITTLEKWPGTWLRLHTPFRYLTDNKTPFGENYTVEFDVIMQLKNNGWIYPEFLVRLLSTGDEKADGNNFFKEYNKYASVVAIMHPGEYKSSKAKLYSFQDNKDYFKSEVKPFGNLEYSYGKPAHFAIQVQKERIRIWVNEEKLFDVPKAIPQGHVMNQLMFEIGSTNYKEDQYAMYISNIKVATGKADTRHKLVEEGSFSTSGILFDVNQASIKPESMGIVKEIADVLNKYPGMKVQIIGHTDADGNIASNQGLSEQRAAAVKTVLMQEYQVAEERMKTAGMGSGKPIADNKTREGKAINRRVEFVKM